MIVISYANRLARILEKFVQFWKPWLNFFSLVSSCLSVWLQTQTPSGIMLQTSQTIPFLHTRLWRIQMVPISRLQTREEQDCSAGKAAGLQNRKWLHKHIRISTYWSINPECIATLIGIPKQQPTSGDRHLGRIPFRRTHVRKFNVGVEKITKGLYLTLTSWIEIFAAAQQMYYYRWVKEPPWFSWRSLWIEVSIWFVSFDISILLAPGIYFSSKNGKWQVAKGPM